MNERAAPEDPNNGTARGAGAPFHTEVRDTHDPLDGLGFNPYGSGPLPIRSRELDADGRTFDITARGGVGRIWRQSNTDWRSSGFGSIARVQVIIGEIRRIRRHLVAFSLKTELPSVENPSGFFRLVSRIRLANVVSVQEMLLQMRRRGKDLCCLCKWRRLRLFTVLGFCGTILGLPT